MFKLEKEQNELLSTLVEAARSMPCGERQSFFACWMGIGSHEWSISHPGIPGDILVPGGDIVVLDQSGFVMVSERDKGTLTFDMSPQGFAYYEEMKSHKGLATKRIEEEIRSYFDANGFQKRYPVAHTKWEDAESKLWGSDSAGQLTTIGHLCREAMQEFAKALIEIHKPDEIDPNVAHTKNRIQSVIYARSKHLGDTEKPFLDALICYWDSIDDLTQRQVHGVQKKGNPLLWEDGRRLVFNVAVVMFEIDRALTRSPSA